MAVSESSKDKGTKSQVHPGDEAAPGTPGTGENICPTCKGSGEVRQKPCPDCGGTGKVVEGIGGG
jgi:DnaJ-class molecular chaperone